MPLPVFPRNPWLSAHEEFLKDLSDEEKRLYENATLENLFQDANETREIHKNHSRAERVAQKLQPLTGAIEQYAKALDAIANTSGVILCPLWGTFRVLLQIASEFGSYFERLGDMLERIGNALPRFRSYEGLFPGHDGLLQALAEVFLDIIYFCVSAKAVFRRGKRHGLNLPLQLIWKPFNQQFGKVMENFHKHAQNVSEQAMLAHMIEAKANRELNDAERQELARQRMIQRRTQLLRMLSIVKWEEQQQKLRKKRHRHTGQWLTKLDPFKDWLRSRSSDCLRCVGIPGAGKSVLCSTVIDYLLSNVASNHSVVLYFYFDYLDEESLKMSSLLGTLIHQVLRRGPIEESIESRITELFDNGIRNPHWEELLELLLSVITPFKRCHIVIDGIDECDKDSRRDMLLAVDQLLAFEQTDIKLYLSCREDAEVESSLRSFPRIFLSDQLLATDIKVFVRDVVQEKIDSGDLQVRDPDLREDIVSELVLKAHGMFLWVSFQLDDLCEAESEAKIREVLQNLPEGLVGTYKRIMNRLEKMSAHRISLAQRIFDRVLAARRPLLLDELKEAVAFEPSDTCWQDDKIPTDPDGAHLMQTCRNLVLIDPDQTVRFTHHTVLQFFLADVFHGLFHFSPAKASAHLGSICVAYLLFTDFDAQITFSPQPQPQPLNALQQIGLHPFLQVGFRRISFVMSFGGGFVETWFRLRGININKRKLLDIDFAQFRRRPTAPSAKLQEKYRLLDYAMENWTFHTADYEPDDSSTWRAFRRLVFEKVTTFEFRPWALMPCPDGLPLLPIFTWAVQAGVPSLMRAMPDANEDSDIMTYYRHALHYDFKPLEIASRLGHAKVIELLEVNPTALRSEDATWKSIIHGQHSCLEVLVRNGTHLVLAERAHGRKALHTASRRGHDQVVKVLLDQAKGQEYQVSHQDIDESLQLAANLGYHETVRQLLNALPRHYKPCQSTGRTPLHWGARKGHQGVVRLLIDHQDGIIKEGDLGGDTALHLASKNGYRQVVKLLLHAGADADCENQQGCMPLQLAVNNGHDQVLRQLINNGAKLPAAPSEYREMIRKAVENGFEKVVYLLWRKDPSVWKRPLMDTLIKTAARGKNAGMMILLAEVAAKCNWSDESGQDILHLAVGFGSEPLVTALLKGGADVNAIDEKMCPLLHKSIPTGSPLLLSILLTNGADPTAEDRRGRKVVHMAAEEGRFDLLTLLVQRGINPHTRDRNGFNALDIAVDEGRDDLIRYLFSIGVRLSTRDQHRPDREERAEKGLHRAIKHGYIPTVRILLEAWPDLADKTGTGYTALQTAVSYGQTEVAAMLLERGTTPGIEDHRGRNELHLAAMIGHEDIVDLLMHYGMTADSMDMDGQTALDLAVICGRTSILSRLLEFGNMGVTISQLQSNLSSTAKRQHESATKLILETLEERQKDELLGGSILHCAVLNGDLALIRKMNRSPYLRLADSKGRTARDLAAEIGKDDIAEFLETCLRALLNGPPSESGVNELDNFFEPEKLDVDTESEDDDFVSFGGSNSGE